jgi:hypothetical protein
MLALSTKLKIFTSAGISQLEVELCLLYSERSVTGLQKVSTVVYPLNNAILEAVKI